MSQDPTGLGPDSNPYRYCGNGATDATDPTGLAAVPPPVTGVLPVPPLRDPNNLPPPVILPPGPVDIPPPFIAVPRSSAGNGSTILRGLYIQGEKDGHRNGMNYYDGVWVDESDPCQPHPANPQPPTPITPLPWQAGTLASSETIRGTV